MKKLFIYSLLLMTMLTSCLKSEESTYIEPTGIGTFQLRESSCELHYAVYQRVYSNRDMYCITFLSKDGLKKVELDVMCNNGELKSGTYNSLGQSFIAEGDRLKALITLSEAELYTEPLELEVKKTGGEYELKLYHPETPDADILTWKGKIVLSSVLR